MPPPRIQPVDLAALPQALRQPLEQGLAKPLKLYMDDASRAIGLTWRRGDNLAFYEDLRVDVSADWLSPTMQNSWGDGGAFYRKTEAGDLELDGNVTAPGGGAVANTTMFTVPFPPERYGRFVCPSVSGGADTTCQVAILTTGEVQWRSATTGASQPVYLSGIKLPCADRQPYQPAGTNRWPLDLPYVLEGRPLGLFLLEAREREPAGTPIRAPIGGVDWELRENRGARELRVRRVAGLAPGKSYTLRLVVVGG